LDSVLAHNDSIEIVVGSPGSSALFIDNLAIMAIVSIHHRYASGPLIRSMEQGHSSRGGREALPPLES
jgi:hypothetical protein